MLVDGSSDQNALRLIDRYIGLQIPCRFQMLAQEIIHWKLVHPLVATQVFAAAGQRVMCLPYLGLLLLMELTLYS
jgi:hypothetical protein